MSFLGWCKCAGVILGVYLWLNVVWVVRPSGSSHAVVTDCAKYYNRSLGTPSMFAVLPACLPWMPTCKVTLDVGSDEN